MTIIDTAPTADQVIATLTYDGGQRTILARVERGPFTAEVMRWDGRDQNEGYSSPVEITIDSNTGDVGTTFNDINALPEHVDDLLAVVTEIVSDYRKVVR